jgi:ribosomal protein S27E
MSVERFEAAKESDRERIERESKETQKKLKQLGRFGKLPINQCPNCEASVNIWIGSHYINTCPKCGHTWTLVKGFENSKNEKG